MFGSSFMSALPSTASSSGGDDKSSRSKTALPFSGFGSPFVGGGAGATGDAGSAAGGSFGFGGVNASATSSSTTTAASSPFNSFSMGKFAGGKGGAVNNSTAISDNNKSGGRFAFGDNKNCNGNDAQGPSGKTLFSLTAAAAKSSSITPVINSNISNTTISLEHTCLSPDGRSFHSYMYDKSIGKHIIVSDFAPFVSPLSSSPSWNGNSSCNNSAIGASLQIRTILPTSVSEAISIDPVIGLICVEGEGDSYDDGRKRRMKNFSYNNNNVRQGDGKELITLPWMCLYTCSSAFLLSIGYTATSSNEDEEDTTTTTTLDGEIVRILEPFEKELLMAPRGSIIIRIRPAPSLSSSSSSSPCRNSTSIMFHRCGSMALLMREGGEEDSIGHVLLLYHGLPESLLGGAGVRRGGGRGSSERDKRYNSTSEGCVSTPLRFDHEDLVRGMEDTLDAENEAYNFSSSSLRRSASSLLTSNNKTVTDFCFLSQESSSSASGASKAFAAISILVLCSDGSVYSASPIIFDGTLLPRSVVYDAITHLDTEIEASASFVASLPLSPVASTEQEQVEARMRQCKAARRYLLDAFGIPDGGTSIRGSYHVSATIAHPRPSYSSNSSGNEIISEALSWQSRLQGPLVMVPQSEEGGATSSSCVCIEPFGGVAGAGILDGFVVAQSCSRTLTVDFGIIPGEGSVVLPRFEFESDADCLLIDELLRGTGTYVEKTLIKDDLEEGNADEIVKETATLITTRNCSIVIDPLDDIMVHICSKSRIATISTNAIAFAAQRMLSRMNDKSSNDGKDLASVQTKVWSALETANTTFILGAGVSTDVHLGHILFARLSSGSVEVVNITAAKYLHESSELMKAKSEQFDASDGDDAALGVLKTVKPLHELLQPLVDKVSDGLSKMGKIVGGSTFPKDTGPEILSIFLETQRSCEMNVVTPIEEMSMILHSRRDLLTEMYDHQVAEVERLTKLLEEFKRTHESNATRVKELELNASTLAERSSAVLIASRSLHPHVTDAEAAYFKDLQRYDSTCKKWDEKVSQLKRDATSSCHAMSAGAIQKGEVRCLVDLPPEKIDVCHKMLRGEAQLLKQLEQKVKKSSDVVEELSKAMSKGETSDTHIRLMGIDKENHT